jgi:hypothetical protein
MLDTETDRSHPPLSPLLGVDIGSPRTHDNLAVFPLLAPDLVGFPYVLLTDALAEETLHITEVGSGSVPDLMASNAGDADVLILDGEQLIGAKQNRITNRTILLGARTETQIPVSCMEQGRWHFETDRFRSRPKPRHAPSRVRRKAREAETLFAAAPDRAGIDVMQAAQRDVWTEVAALGSSLGAHSATGAMDEFYDRHAESLESWIARFPCAEGQVGLLALIGGRPLGVDVVGSPELYARLHERILGGYCMDALSWRGRADAHRDIGAPGADANDGPDLSAAADHFLAEVGSAARGLAPTAGKGTYRLLSGAAIGAELAEGERLVHLSAFPGAE